MQMQKNIRAKLAPFVVPERHQENPEIIWDHSFDKEPTQNKIDYGGVLCQIPEDFNTLLQTVLAFWCQGHLEPDN